jgi:hypothetical protein
MPEKTKMPNKFYCECCDYSCSKKSNFEIHLATDKHFWKQNGNAGNAEKSNCLNYTCDKCNKVYKSASGLWKHQNKCKHENINDSEQIDLSSLDINLIMQLLKQNDEFKNLMVEQNNKMMETFQETLQGTIQEVCKNGINNNNSHNNVNSHNKTFNLQVFLNEQCKDAMNIMDFVDSIKLDLSDLESVGKLGYINGISNIIIKNLKALDVHMRPVHCTDLKRETMYVKSQNEWEKEDEENKNIRRAIKHIAFKNYKNLELFQELHPDCLEYDSKHGDHFLRLRIEALGGGSSNVDYDSQTKIIKKIAKEVTIDKTQT